MTRDRCSRRCGGCCSVAAFLVFLAGLQLFVFPLRTEDWFAWTIDVPMTAVFLGASYWSSAVLEVAGSRAAGGATPGCRSGRFRLHDADAGGHAGPPRQVPPRRRPAGQRPAGDVGVAGDLRRRPRGDAGHRLAADPGGPGGLAVRRRRGPLATGLRALLVVLAVVLLGTGVVLLVAPATAAVLWAWPLTDLTARAVGAWLVGLGWAAGHARLVDDVAGVRSLGLDGCDLRGAAGGRAGALRRRADVVEPGGGRVRRRARRSWAWSRADPGRGRAAQSSGRNGVSIASVNRRWRSRASHSESVSSRQLVWSSWKISSSDRANDSSIASTLTS